MPKCYACGQTARFIVNEKGDHYHVTATCDVHLAGRVAFHLPTCVEVRRPGATL